MNDLWQSKFHQICVSHGGRFLRADVKREARALQKTYRSYAKNWRKLTDLVRSSLVFASFTDMARCLNAIADDPEVVVLATSASKMRLRQDYDCAELGGYRDVQLSARLTSPEARLRGCHEHIGEVQLHLDAMNQLKHGGGHKAYVLARNMRGQ